VKHILDKPFYCDDPIDIINIRLKRFKKHFKEWGANIFGNMKMERRKIDSWRIWRNLSCLRKTMSYLSG
jgi:hypothetical protein